MDKIIEPHLETTAKPASTINPGRQTDAPRLQPRTIAITSVAVVLCIAALIAAVLHFGDMSAFAAQAASADPIWLGLAICGQLAAFLTAALIWRSAFNAYETTISLGALFQLSIAKLFTDQALPSAGLSGAAFVLHAFRRRGAGWDAAFIAFVLGSASFILAFVIASIISLVALAAHAAQAPDALKNGVKGLMTLMTLTVLIIGAASALRRLHHASPFAEEPAARQISNLIDQGLRALTERPILLLRLTLAQIAARFFDAATLWLCAGAIGLDVSVIGCFYAVSLASIAATIAPMPLGVGPFESALVAALSIGGGASFEASMAATLLYRGVSLWLPLLPGFIIAQREMLSTPRRQTQDTTQSSSLATT